MGEIDRITDLLRRQVAKRTPPKAWSEFIATLPCDEVDDAELETVEVDVIGNQFIIRYVDAKKQESQRRILVKGIGYCDGELALNAYCYERSARRTFLASRITEAISASTGEIIEDAQGYFAALSAKSPTAEALERAAPGTQILASLAICDGHMDAEEVQVILGFIDSCATSRDIDWNIAEAYVRAIWPEPEAFERAIRRLSFYGTDETAHIIRAAKKLVLADGVLRQQEAALMAALIGDPA